MNSTYKNQNPTASIIIPTFNEASVIGETLGALTKISEPVEVIVVDGGSSDDTGRIVLDRQVNLLTAERGRGAQMDAGAALAQSDVLWFLHADTRVPADAVGRIAAALQDPQVVGGNFAVCFDGSGSAVRFMTWLYPQLRRLGLSYGDSAIFIRREAYQRAGGFRPIPIFEDLDLVRELKKLGRIVHLPAPVITSSRRFAGRKFPLVLARWAGLQVLYWLGVAPHKLARLYAPVRQSGNLRFGMPARKQPSGKPATD